MACHPFSNYEFWIDIIGITVVVIAAASCQHQQKGTYPQ
jgi:hypothetical protein